MSEEHIVHYFDVRGRAEPIRMILAYAGAKWKDQRIPYNTFPAVIPTEIKSGKCFIYQGHFNLQFYFVAKCFFRC